MKKYMRRNELIKIILIVILSLILITMPVVGTTLEKFVDKMNVTRGEELTYTILVNFTENTSNVSMVDSLPNGLIYKGDSQNGILEGRNITWNWSTINASIIRIVLNASVDEAYGDSEISNNSVTLNYELNGSTYSTNANSPRIEIREKSKVAFLLISSGDEALVKKASRDGILNVSVFLHYKFLPPYSYPVPNLSEYDVIFLERVIQESTKEIIEPEIIKAKDRNASIIAVHCSYPELGNVNLTEHPYIQQYWDNRTLENIKRLINYLGFKFCGLEGKVEEPLPLPSVGIYHPNADKIFENLSEYLQWYESDDGTHHVYNPSNMTIGILFWSGRYPIEVEIENAVIKALEKRGANVIAAYPPTILYGEDALKIFSKDNQSKVDAIIDLGMGVAGISSLVYKTKYLEFLNVPVINGIELYRMTPSDWRNSSQGMEMQYFPYQIMIMEIAGEIESIVVGGREYNPAYDAFLMKPIESQVNWIVDRTLSWAKLRYLNNSEKKIAIIYYAHEGNDSALIASYLDIPPSIVNLLSAMKEKGYSIGETPNSTELIDLVLKQGKNIGIWAPDELRKMVENHDVALIPENEYLKWFNELPEVKRTEVVNQWGEPPGDIMVYKNETGKYIVIPKISFGNVVITPQPSRASTQNMKALYHNKSIPPTHQYIAFYFWLKRGFEANAIISMGRHGTQEWLPGKGVGLSRDDCWPAILIQDIPVVYPYIVDGIGEGIMAKRRGNAVMIDHLTPPIAESGLYGNLSYLEQLIQLYNQAENGTLKNEYKKEIIEISTNISIDKDLSINLNATLSNETKFEEFLEELHDYLLDLKSEYMPYGLHIMGRPLSNESLIVMTKSMLGYEFKEDVKKMNLSDEYIKMLLWEVIINKTNPIEAQNKVIGNASDKLTNYLNLSIKYAENLSNCVIEIPRTLQALEGKYIPPGPGNDPIRDPNVLPTGRNFYSFDPAIVPTKAAWSVGKKLADQLISQYLNETGSYPRKIGFVLFSGETMKHQGIIESQILYLLGVKPKWDTRGRVTGVELIPMSELKRPRIDVVVTITGVYRDNWPDKVRLIAEAICISAMSNDSSNYVRENAEAIKAWLIKNGYNESVASNLSMIRIFGPPDGKWGTGLPAAVQRSDTWENEDKLAKLYIDTMAHVYGVNIWGEQYSDLFRQNLDRIEVAIFSRSSNIYGVLDTDHPYEFLGGLGLAVRTTSGETPEMYIVNLRDPVNSKIETLSQFLIRELRTRYFNPYWIEGMQEHGYAGAREIADGLANLWGWEVMDPNIVSDYMWKEMYDIYINDKYNLGLNEWFNQHNPYALQSIAARMLEVIRKGYWSPSEDVKKAIAEVYRKSVEQYGVTCCHHTCANPFLDDYISGILSIPEEQAVEQPLVGAVQYRTGGWRRAIEGSGRTNETVVESGVAIPKAGEEPAKPPEETKPTEESGPAKEVVGRIMEEKESESAISISGAPLLGLVGAIAILILIGIGYWLRKI